MDDEQKGVFNQNLIRLRKERGLTQQKLAVLSGISQRMIAYYESDELVNPPMEKIGAIAKALNVNFEDLVGSNKPSQIQNEFLQIDSRTLSKIKMILSLPKNERHTIYSIAEALIAKRKLSESENNQNELKKEL